MLAIIGSDHFLSSVCGLRHLGCDLLHAKRCYMMNAVFPVIVIDGMTSKTEPPPHHISRKINTVWKNTNLEYVRY